MRRSALLSGTDVHGLSGFDRVRVLAARQQMVSHYSAGVMDAMVAVPDAVDADWEEDPKRAAEVQAALVLTRRAGYAGVDGS